MSSVLQIRCCLGRVYPHRMEFHSDPWFVDTLNVL